MEKKNEVEKIHRLPNETFEQCVKRGIPVLILEGMSPEQANAAARSMCELKKEEKDFWKGVLN